MFSICFEFPIFRHYCKCHDHEWIEVIAGGCLRADKSVCLYCSSKFRKLFLTSFNISFFFVFELDRKCLLRHGDLYSSNIILLILWFSIEATTWVRGGVEYVIQKQTQKFSIYEYDIAINHKTSKLGNNMEITSTPMKSESIPRWSSFTTIFLHS